MLSQAEIDARLARFRISMHGSDLWPDVPVAAFRAAQREVARVAAAVLGGESAAVALGCPPGVNAHVLGVAAFPAGMGPLLGYWIESERVTAEPDIATLFAAHLDHGRRRATRLRAELNRILGAFAERGVEGVLLKGMHTATRYFPDPGTRPSADIDLLVSPGDCPGAIQALRALGFTPEAPSGTERPGHWLPRDVGLVRSLELAHADDPWHLDLHVSLDRALFPGLTVGYGRVARADTEPWDALGYPVRVLREPLLLAFLALHTSTHFYSMQLIRLVELILVGRADLGGSEDRWREFGELIRRARTGRFVFPALDLAERLVPGTVSPGVLEWVRAAAPRGFRRRVRALDPSSAQPMHPRPQGELYVWVRTPWQWLGALAEIAWPRQGETRLSPIALYSRYARRLRRLSARLLGRRPS